MPLTPKGEAIKKNMEKQYGAKKGESVFYASKNKGTISGVESREEVEGKARKKILEQMGGLPKIG